MCCSWLLFTLWLAAGHAVDTSKALPRATVQAHSHPTSRFLMAHYMPWFEADALHRRWGWHWTMNHYHPDQKTGEKREAASHYYPLIGLYDSGDPDALECQALLMKLAGIDGVIIDWYGPDDFLDYGLIHRNTQRFIEIARKAGLRFAICYEDQSVPKWMAGNRLPEQDAVAHGQTLLRWMQRHWFTDSAYLRQDNRPVLLVFGGGYYRSDQWNTIFAGLPQEPEFFSESNRRPPAAGAFDWPQPGHGTEQSLREMDAFYARATEWPAFIPSAFPRFHDIYQEAGVQTSWGKIEDRNGKTYAETLERALKSPASLIQLVTWNDWGEGTQIEPSLEFGCRDLEVTQRLRRRHIEGSFPYTAQDLRLPIALYALRKRFPHKQPIGAKLEEASQFLFAGNVARARRLIAALSKRLMGR